MSKNLKLKRFSCILVIVLVILSFTACGKKSLKEPDIYKKIGLKPVSEVVQGARLIEIEKGDFEDQQGLSYACDTEDGVLTAIESYHDYLVAEKMSDLTDDKDEIYLFENNVCRISISRTLLKKPEPKFFIVIKSLK